MLFSALLGRSVGAVVATYGTLLALMVLPLILLGVYEVITSSQHRSGAATLGDIWGALLVTAVGLVCGWLAYLSLRWVWRRLLGDRLRVLGHLLPSALVLVGLFYVLKPGSFVLSKAAALEAGWLFLLQPFLGLASLMEGTNIIPGMFGPSGGHSGANLQVLIWFALTGTALLAAFVGWALAIRAFRVRG